MLQPPNSGQDLQSWCSNAGRIISGSLPLALVQWELRENLNKGSLAFAKSFGMAVFALAHPRQSKNRPF